MVDMSPEAVTRRLRLMDELWELSVKLMNSRNVTASEYSVEEPRVVARQDGGTGQNLER